MVSLPGQVRLCYTGWLYAAQLIFLISRHEPGGHFRTTLCTAGSTAVDRVASPGVGQGTKGARGWVYRGGMGGWYRVGVPGWAQYRTQGRTRALAQYSTIPVPVPSQGQYRPRPIRIMRGFEPIRPELTLLASIDTVWLVLPVLTQTY